MKVSIEYGETYPIKPYHNKKLSVMLEKDTDNIEVTIAELLGKAKQIVQDEKAKK